MIEQKVIINLTDENSNNLGTLTVSSIDCKNCNESRVRISNSLELINIPVVDSADNLTPIQYCPDIGANFANLMFLEETERIKIIER